MASRGVIAAVRDAIASRRVAAEEVVRHALQRIEHTRGHDIISDGVPLGGIQVVGDGQPIVLLADRQSTGGYTKIGAVCSFDIGRVCQVKPGQRLRFRQVSVAEAHEFLRAYRKEVDEAITFPSP